MKRKLPILALCLAACISAGHSQEASNPPLDSAVAITSLTDRQAGSELPIQLQATVTAVESDWNGQFFLQDETGGVWVEYFGDDPPAVGDLLSIRGQSHPGAFAPIIAKPTWQRLREAPLPTAQPVAIEDLVLGVHDGRRVQIEGTVRAAELRADRLEAVLAVGGHRLEVRAPSQAVGNPQSLIGATVRVRGTTATHYNQRLRQLTGVAVYIVRSADFEILSSEEIDPFDTPIIPMNRVAQFRESMGSNRRIHIRGQVTHRGIGPMLFVQDKTAALRIMSDRIDGIRAGQEVDIAGFLEFENHLPFLNDGVFKNPRQTTANIPPTRVPPAEIKMGLHHGEIVSLTGKVLDRTHRPILDASGNQIGESTTWLVQGEDLSFTVEYDSLALENDKTIAPIGSLIEATGVCYSELDPQVSLKSVKVLLSSASGIKVLKQPSWLTPARLLAGLAILTPLLIIAISWSLTVSKKNARLKELVREKQEAQDLLQEANETLEQKVEERSAQLQVEMSARKEARLQFKAVISERTRLARDLHDTLEQALTGIALQLETANKLFNTSSENAQTHVALARRWLQQSQIELRHSIWDLRSRELEQFDLAQALKQSVQRLADSMDLKMDFATDGEKRSLSEVVEENVLRIGQEAMTNIAKHSQASEVQVKLSFTENELSLEIKDNGKGFHSEQPFTSPEKHYGLLGMRERANRINGKLLIKSNPTHGTAILVQAPITNGSAKNHLNSPTDET